MGADERDRDFLPEGHIYECYSAEEATSESTSPVQVQLSNEVDVRYYSLMWPLYHILRCLLYLL
jgi:hypothetical protein